MSFSLFFKYSNKLVKLIAEISSIQSKVEMTQYSVPEMKKIHFLAMSDSVHYSTKIEGNPLTLKQVTVALDQKSSNKSNRNLKEVLNYAKARNYIENLKTNLDEKSILTSHDLVLNGIVLKSHRGKYRKAQNAIKGSNQKHTVYLPPEWSDVQDLMKDLIIWTRKNLSAKDLSPLIISGLFHFQFVTIHPFMDGNGRLARLWSHASFK